MDGDENTSGRDQLDRLEGDTGVQSGYERRKREGRPVPEDDRDAGGLEPRRASETDAGGEEGRVKPQDQPSPGHGS